MTTTTTADSTTSTTMADTTTSGPTTSGPATSGPATSGPTTMTLELPKTGPTDVTPMIAAVAAFSIAAGGALLLARRRSA